MTGGRCEVMAIKAAPSDGKNHEWPTHNRVAVLVDSYAPFAPEEPRAESKQRHRTGYGTSGMILAK